MCAYFLGPLGPFLVHNEETTCAARLGRRCRDLFGFVPSDDGVDVLYLGPGGREVEFPRIRCPAAKGMRKSSRGYMVPTQTSPLFNIKEEVEPVGEETKARETQRCESGWLAHGFYEA